jgi:HAD superfamily phosphoserine phosphatase-like hydrolase
MLGRVQTATVEEIIARIDSLAEADARAGAIVFDGDGTLWSGDIGEDFFDALIAHDRFTEVARAALAVEAEAEKISTSGGGADVARRIHEAYHAGTFPEERVCEIMTWACAGWTRAELDTFAARVLETLGLSARLHEEALRVARWAKERGIAVYLVSASPRAIVEQAARLVGVDATRIASATEECDAGGVVLTSVLRPIPYGPGKVTRLREKLGTRTLYAAFGDNVFDVAMLRDARVPVAVRPKERLVEHASEVPGLVTLQRA